jgi:hypothetical protein
MQAAPGDDRAAHRLRLLLRTRSAGSSGTSPLAAPSMKLARKRSTGSQTRTGTGRVPALSLQVTLVADNRRWRVRAAWVREWREREAD